MAVSNNCRRLLLLTVALASFAAAESCADQHSCAACGNVTGCHWCADGGCHVYGSPYGCIAGISCYTLESCKRVVAEWVGFQSPPAAVIAVSLSLAVAVLCCGCCCVQVWKRVREHHTTYDLKRDAQYFELESLELMEEEEADGDELAFSERDRRGRQRRRRSSSGAGSGMRVSKHSHPLAVACDRGTRLCCVLTNAAALLAMLLALLYWPQPAAYSTCNKKQFWLPALHGLQGGLHGDVQVLTSVYNPNRFDMRLQEMHASFAFEGAKIAVWDLKKEWNVPAGSVADLVMQMKFTPTARQAAAMLTEYISGALVLDMDAHGQGQLLIAGTAVYSPVLDYSNVEFHVGDKTDHTWCNCSKHLS